MIAQKKIRTMLVPSTLSRAFPTLTIVASTALLVACGGGSDGGDSAAPLTLTGTAASGLAMKSALVTANCTNGSGSTTSDANNGTYTITIAGASLPCMIQVKGKDTKGADVTYHSVVATGTVANVTPLTQAQLEQHFGDASKVGAEFQTGKAPSLTQTDLDLAWKKVQTLFASVAGMADLKDPISTKLAAATSVGSDGKPVGGDAYDQVLDAFQLAQQTPTTPVTPQPVTPDPVTPDPVTPQPVASRFVKLDASGNALADSATAWVCVKDTVTNLIWLDSGYFGNKGAATEFANYDDGTKFQKSVTSNGGTVTYKPTYSEMASTINALWVRDKAATANVCGLRDWRMPIADELMGLVDNTVSTPVKMNPVFTNGLTVDASTTNVRFWTSSPGGSDTQAVAVDFMAAQGAQSVNFTRQYNAYVRLVSGALVSNLTFGTGAPALDTAAPVTYNASHSAADVRLSFTPGVTGSHSFTGYTAVCTHPLSSSTVYSTTISNIEARTVDIASIPFFGSTTFTCKVGTVTTGGTSFSSTIPVTLQ